MNQSKDNTVKEPRSKLSTQASTQASTQKYWIIVPAAGLGKRMGASVAKQYLKINNKTILELTLDRLSQLSQIEKIILVLHPLDSIWQTLESSGYSKVVTVKGGSERADSVLNGLHYLQKLNPPNVIDADDWVLVHDAVRPCVAIDDIDALVTHFSSEVNKNVSGGILASPIMETVKQGKPGNDEINNTLDRSRLWLAATPQMFRFGILLEAIEAAISQDIQVSDEASAVEALGHTVKLIRGRKDNIKITSQEDLKLAEFILNQQTQVSYRPGESGT